MSLDFSFITASFELCYVNLGLIHCKEGTSGDKVAAAIAPALGKHEVLKRVYAYVKDQGSNLKTTAAALSEGLEDTPGVCCEALGLDNPFAADCLAHALNGACNKCVVDAKKASFPGINVASSLMRLRECGTYIKKSSVGLRAYTQACRQVGMPAKKIECPGKTRFTSVSAVACVMSNSSQIISVVCCSIGEC
jgi:hypothetical protein